MDPFPYGQAGLDFLKYADSPDFDAFGAVEKGIDTGLQRQYQQLQNQRAEEVMAELKRRRAVQEQIAAQVKANPSSNLEAVYTQAAQIALANGDLDAAMSLDKAGRQSQFSPINDADAAAIAAATGVKIPAGTSLAAAQLINQLKNADANNWYRRERLADADAQRAGLENWRKMQAEAKKGKRLPFKEWYTIQTMAGSPPTPEDVAAYLMNEANGGAPAAGPAAPTQGTPAPTPPSQPKVTIRGMKPSR